MTSIKLYRENEIEYARLETFKYMANKRLMGTKYQLFIETTYADYSSGWMYTALITDRDGDTWQSLSFKDYETVVNCDSITEMEKMANKYADGLMSGNICVRL